ncbi:MAG: response regulator [Runella sp.]
MQRLKILIVEDEAITAMDIQQTLEIAGHTVLATTDSYQQALDTLKMQPPDLAIVDIKLNHSEADGIFLAKELRKFQIPVIFLTANTEPQTVHRAKEATPTAYLLKPFRSDELLIQIELAWTYFIEKQRTSDHHLFFPIKNKGHKRIDIDRVLYVKAFKSDTEIYVFDEVAPYVVSTHLANISQYFSSPNFFRLSRSLLVNLHQIDSIDTEKLYLKSKTHTIDISPPLKKELLQHLKIVKTKPLS